MCKFTDSDMKEFCLLKSEVLIKCMMCGELTPYVDYISEGRLCSKNCFNKFYDRYQQWVNKIERIEAKERGETNEED